MVNKDHCELYGCLKDKAPGSTLTVAIGEVSVTLEVCSYHHTLVTITPPTDIQFGLTYTGEVELRRVPAFPAEPAS